MDSSDVAMLYRTVTGFFFFIYMQCDMFIFISLIVKPWPISLERKITCDKNSEREHLSNLTENIS